MGTPGACEPKGEKKLSIHGENQVPTCARHIVGSGAKPKESNLVRYQMKCHKTLTQNRNMDEIAAFASVAFNPSPTSRNINLRLQTGVCR